jgi:alkylation response protein AidB-like acyl-CoA dehydrogenase
VTGTARDGARDGRRGETQDNAYNEARSGAHEIESADRAALRALAREVADRELAPRAAEGDETERFPDPAWRALRAADLLGITIGERYGGSGLGDVEAAIVLEELARADVSAAILAQLVYNGPARAIEHLGPAAMRERWLPPAARGEALFCIGITEADTGSAVHRMRARLEPDGGGYRLHAYKNYVTGGHRAAACLVWCRFPGGHIGAVLVDAAAAGVTVTGLHRKMGLRAMAEAELAFDGVRVEPGDVLVDGDQDGPQGLKTLLFHLNHERCGNAAMCVGAAQGALEYAAGYVRERRVGDTRLADLQGLRWKLADMAIELEAARLLLYRAAGLAGRGGTPPALETAMAKAKANLAAKFVCDEAIQLLGGYGFSREYPVERVYRDVRGLCIGAGTVEVQRNYVGGRIAAGTAPSGPAWRLR